MPAEIYGSGTTPQIGDTKRMLLVKLIQATTALGTSGGGSVMSGHGAPVSAPTVDDAIYYDLDTFTIYLWDSGASSWT